MNETLARTFYPGASPIGRRIKWGSPTSRAPWATIVGVNARNLRAPADLDRERVDALHGLVRAGQLLVAESGITTPADVEALPARVDAVLVGTALMTAADPAALVRSLAGVRR